MLFCVAHLRLRYSDITERKGKIMKFGKMTERERAIYKRGKIAGYYSKKAHERRTSRHKPVETWGSFNAADAFQKALQRSYGDLAPSREEVKDLFKKRK